MNRGGSPWEVLWVSLKLGLTSFGGPVAHLGYFREEYVARRKWLSEAAYADLVALCQFLPGPASSQVGIGIGMTRAGWLGGLAAWFGFTMPSVVALILFAILLGESAGDSGWIHGLKIAAVAIVFQAVWGMYRSLASDRVRGTIALTAAALLLLFPHAWLQLGVIAAAGLVGRAWLTGRTSEASEPSEFPLSKRAAVWCLAACFGLLALLPAVRLIADSVPVAIFDAFYRVGSLVFGGGHVVLPLLQGEVVSQGWVTESEFLAGYGATQAVPGPLFTFSAYLGVLAGEGGAAVGYGLLAVAAIFLPSFLLVAGTLPYWNQMRRREGFQSALAGINAAVVGILLAALYDPVFTSSVEKPEDAVLAIVAAGMLMVWKLPPWAVVAFSAAAGAAMSDWI